VTVAITLIARVTVGTVFAISLASKISRWRAFASFVSWLSDLSVIPKGMETTVGIVFVAAETSIVILLVPQQTVDIGLLVAAATLACFVAFTYWIMRKNIGASCHCFGPSSSLLSARHISRDLALFVLAILGIPGAAVSSPDIRIVAVCVLIGVILALSVVFLDDLISLLPTHDPDFAENRGNL
jgi:hypothetical protein